MDVMPELPKRTLLPPRREAVQMVAECLHDVVECYEVDAYTITFTRNGVDYEMTVNVVGMG